MYICHFTLITRGGSPFKPILFKQLLPLTHPADVLAHSHPLVVFCHAPQRLIRTLFWQKGLLAEHVAHRR